MVLKTNGNQTVFTKIEETGPHPLKELIGFLVNQS
jgi:hypothetical protein